MSLSLPKCDFCKHFREETKEKAYCDAFPDGIPEDKNIFDYDDDSECANGIKFEDVNGKQEKFIPDSESILAKMHRI